MTLNNPLSHYDKGWRNGASVRGMRFVETTAGNTFYVSSATGNNGAAIPGTVEQPLATFAEAISRCTANNGDCIFFLPGHAETLSSAAAVAFSKAGVVAQSLGVGNDRAKFTFGTVVGASIALSGQGSKLLDVIGIAALDSLTGPITVTAPDSEVDIEWRDGSSTIEAVRVVDLSAAAVRAKVRVKHIGFSAGDACVSVVRVVGGRDARIHVDAYGKMSVAAVQFATTATINANIFGYVYNSGTTDGSKLVVDTITGSTWFAEIMDGGAGKTYRGGSGNAMTALT